MEIQQIDNNAAVRAAITTARQEVERYPSLAVFIVRDYQQMREAGLDDLAWSMARNGCATSEAVWLLDELEKYLNKQEAHDEQQQPLLEVTSRTDVA